MHPEILLTYLKATKARGRRSSNAETCLAALLATRIINCEQVSQDDMSHMFPDMFKKILPRGSAEDYYWLLARCTKGVTDDDTIRSLAKDLSEME